MGKKIPKALVARLGIVRVSKVVRTVNLRVPSNRFVAAASAAGFLAVLAREIAGGTPYINAGRAGMQIALSIFLAWAVARELDPDSTSSAGLAAFAGAAIYFMGEAGMWSVAALLFAVRITLRSSGSAPNVFDLIWLPGIAALSAQSPGGWIAGLALAFALALTCRLPQKAPRRSLISAVVAVAAVAFVSLAKGALGPSFLRPTVAQSLVLAAALLSIPALRARPPKSVGDEDGHPLHRKRLTSARALALATGLLTTVWIGGRAVPELASLWAATIGVGVTVLRGAHSGETSG